MHWLTQKLSFFVGAGDINWAIFLKIFPDLQNFLFTLSFIGFKKHADPYCYSSHI